MSNLLLCKCTNLIKNANGQVSLFIALTFQILFLFFAMVINVGLLVHHKINLQNSVDFAAYYGAMKQAENLNAIAHVNYQIRQSYKLLAWRYRAIGSSGDFAVHPYNKITKQLPSNLPDDPGATDERTKNYYDFPAFCAAYVPFKPMPENENTCKDMSAHNPSITLFKPPPVIAGFLGITTAIQNAANQILNQAEGRCKHVGVLNFVNLARFVVAFNLDQADRMKLITQISRQMSTDIDDFYDLDGGSVLLGVEKTLKKNLTSENRNSVSFKMYNSFANSACGRQSSDTNTVPRWLSKVKILPLFRYMDTNCSRSSIDMIAKTLSSNSLPQYRNQFSAMLPLINEMSQYLGMRDNPEDFNNLSIGVEKNPWCMGYVGVYAESTPSIPFSPMGSIKLKAKSYAKPFGGRIGPWYGTRWQQTADKSDDAVKTDPLLPKRFVDPNSIGDINNPAELATLAANYSKYVGDQYGLKSKRVIGQFGKGIFELDPRWRNSASPSSLTGETPSDGSAPDFDHWNALPKFATNENKFDILAWSGAANMPSGMRYLELAAIVPDLFDLSYYSIEPDFYNNYYTRIRDFYLPTLNKGGGTPVTVYPDIGYHAGAQGFDNYSVKDQIRQVKDAVAGKTILIDIDTQLTYLAKDWKNVLTSWVDHNLLDYSLDNSKFGKCSNFPIGVDESGQTKATGDVIPTPGNCLDGGRTGYSVKLVSEDLLLHEQMSLGGEGGGEGRILNPPPSETEWVKGN